MTLLGLLDVTFHSAIELVGAPAIVSYALHAYFGFKYSAIVTPYRECIAENGSDHIENVLTNLLFKMTQPSSFFRLHFGASDAFVQFALRIA